MAKRIRSSAWRAFLRALARTGNVRTSAAEAGMDSGTAYDRRARDPAFAGTWAAAAEKAKARAPRKPRQGKGAELVARKTRHGTQLVRAAEGRWNKQAEEGFLAALARTGCVRSAADAAGFSTNALYMRRENYPDFAERWDRAKQVSLKRLPDLLNAASIAALDPEVEGRDLPPVNIDQAIRISKLNAPSSDGPRGRGIRPRVATNAEVEEALRKALTAFRNRVQAQQLQEGWSRIADGRLIPPGWTYNGPAEGEWAPPEGDAQD